MNIMLFAIPVFFLLIGIELLFAKIQQKELYRFSDAVTNISCGIVQQVSGVFMKTLTIGLYYLLYQYARLWEMPNVWWSYILLFILIDCLYYWFHRYSHEINAFWGTHVVHHQSEDYNLSVALRQSAFQSLISGVFYLPLAIMGFDPIPFILINTLQTLYQFWIHTEAIDKMPAWFEYIFNTPSHHRVHHGRNPEYIDKNHGGTLIIFDRMFGTFEAEKAPVVYGVTVPLETWNPIWANFHYYNSLRKELKNMTWGERLRALVEKPGWRPIRLGGPYQIPEVERKTTTKYHIETPKGISLYVFFQYILVLLGTVGFLLAAGKNAWAWQTIIMASLIALSVMNLGGLLDQRAWAKPLEYLRLVALPVVLWMMFGHVFFIQNCGYCLSSFRSSLYFLG